MGLYRETATGFLVERDTNPGAGYTAISDMPSTTADRVAWHRNLDVYGQNSTWHPSLAGTAEYPGPDTRSGSGINIMPNDYTSFEWVGGAPDFNVSNATVIRTTSAWHRNYGIRVTSLVNGGTAWLAPDASTYNIDLQTGSKWIISAYVAPTTAATRTVTFTLKTTNGATFTVSGSTASVAGNWTRISGVFDLSSNADKSARLGISIDTVNIGVDIDAVMLEQQVGPLTGPTAYYSPWSNINGKQIPDYTIDTAKFAQSIKPVEIFEAFPTVGNVEGRIIYLTTDNKLYRFDGTVWTAEVPTTDLSGTISAAQLAANSVTANAIAAGSVTAGKVAAAAISTTELAAGAVAAGKLAANAIIAGDAVIATGAISSAQIGSLTADKITSGTVGAQTINMSGISSIIQSSNFSTGVAGWRIRGDGSAEFQNVTIRGALNASDLTSGLLSIARLQDGSITDAKIGNISANKITVGTLSADRIAAGTITANKLSFTPLSAGGAASDINAYATTIDGSKITTGSLNANRIQAGTITTDRLNFTPLTSGTAANDINTYGTQIDGSRIQTGSLYADRIVAGTITADRIVYGGIDTGRIAGNAATRIASSSAGGAYTSGAIYLPDGAQGLIFIAVGGVSESSGTKPVSANFQLKFNGGEIANGGNYTHPGWGEAIVQSASLGAVGPGYYGFEGYIYNGGGGGNLTVYGVQVFCIASVR